MSTPGLPRWCRGANGVLLGLAALAGLSWWALLELAGRMSMPGMAEMAARPWSGDDFALRLAMWGVMMAAMMLPGALPMVLLFGRVVAARPHPALRVGLFVLAYLALWSGFGLAATLLQQTLERAAWLSPMAMRAVPWLGGLLLVAAGVYQWTPLKRACLRQCQPPFSFLLCYPLATYGDAWRLGLAHGVYCLGCCALLMGLLFALGVMNLLAVVALTAWIALEKHLAGPWPARLGGAVLIVWGLAWWAW